VVTFNDSGVDKSHPDLTITNPGTLTDPVGHGTLVAGIIASTGGKSLTVTNAQGSLMPPTNGQFRVSALRQAILSAHLQLGCRSAGRHRRADLQQQLELWQRRLRPGRRQLRCGRAGRCAGRPGSRPVLFVFSAGNGGGQMNEWDDSSMTTEAEVGRLDPVARHRQERDLGGSIGTAARHHQ